MFGDPAIAERAQAEGAEIHRGDETDVRSDCQHGRSYTPAGQTPVRRVPGSRFVTNMISTVTNQGKVRFTPISNIRKFNMPLDIQSNGPIGLPG
jgi:hypothetical protein